MYLTDHISDEELNEYLDHETTDRARIGLHLASCADCAARLNALQSLFEEIESLPDVAFSPKFTVQVAPAYKLSAPLPRTLTFAVILQAALALVVIVLAAPFVMPLLSPYLSWFSKPALAETFMFLQHEWTTWLDLLSMLQPPSIPQLPLVELSSLFMALLVISVSLLWLIGNGLLLRNRIK